MQSSKRNTHTLFIIFLAILQVWFPWTAYPTKWAGAWLFQRVLSNNIMIFASDKLQVQSHLLVPHKNSHIKIWTHNTQIPLLAIMIFINAINWVCAFQLTYFKELLWMVKPNKQFSGLKQFFLFYFILFYFSNLSSRWIGDHLQRSNVHPDGRTFWDPNLYCQLL
jgi:hypothetical protein